MRIRSGRRADVVIPKGLGRCWRWSHKIQTFPCCSRDLHCKFCSRRKNICFRAIAEVNWYHDPSKMGNGSPFHDFQTAFHFQKFLSQDPYGPSVEKGCDAVGTFNLKLEALNSESSDAYSCFGPDVADIFLHRRGHLGSSPANPLAANRSSIKSLM